MTLQTSSKSRVQMGDKKYTAKEKKIFQGSQIIGFEAEPMRFLDVP